MNCSAASWVLNATALVNDAHRVASTLSTNQTQLFTQLKAILMRGGTEVVSSLVLGGSVVAGFGCKDPLLSPPDGVRCAYPHRFERWMQKCRGYRGFRLTNAATGGTTTISVLPQLSQLVPPSLQPRLLIIDFSTNDAVFHVDVLQNASFVNAPFVAALEVMLIWLRSERPRDAVLLLDSDCVKPSHGLYFGTREAKARVAQHYGVAYLKFSAGFQNSISCSREPSVWTRSRHGHHPGYESHQHVADLLSLWLPALFEAADLRVANDSLHTATDVMPLTTERAREKFEICNEPLSTLSAMDHIDPWKGVRILGGTWELDRTRSDKLGWQTDKPGSALAFQMRFGAKPRLSVVFEQSYETFGDAKIVRSPDEPRGTKYAGEILLVGRSDSNTTQATTVVIQVGPDTVAGREYWNVSPHSNGTFVIRTINTTQKSRFKVRQVSSC